MTARGWLVLGAFVFGTQVQAQVSVLPADGSQDAPVDLLHNKKFEADDRIVDTELKADSGSLSRYSLKANLGYSGPAINSLNDPYKPNPDNKPRPNRTALSGSVGARYRVSSDAAWNVSTGMRWYSPYQAVTNQQFVKKDPNDDQNFTVQDPMVSYDRTYMTGAVQSRTSLKASATTEPYYVHTGQFSELTVEHAWKYNVGTSRWILGGSVPVDLFLFDRDFKKGDGKVSNYYLSVIPSVEYKLSSSLNFKTSLAYAWSNMRMDGSWYKWAAQSPNQWIGLGWGITRDIYVNPYLSFFTANPAIATTSFNINTIVSVF